ncbi:MAG: TlpA disulfide reductase family protein [Dehalococcoidia bacterium]|nr:TlpA disulfide reductase family protein [Dehalococcoidia bacterium]
MAKGRQIDIGQRLLALAGLGAIVGIVVGALAVAGLLGNQAGGKGIEQVTLLDPPRAEGQVTLGVGPAVGLLAPDFEISDFDGRRHRLSDFRGKVVYVNFWGSWCIPCAIELPDILQLQQKHPDDLAVIAVNRRDPLDRARNYLRNLPLNDGGKGAGFTVDAMDPDDTLYDRYRGLAMPVSVFIDPNGVVTRVANGQIDLDAMEEALAQALSGGAIAAGFGSSGKVC